MSSSISSEWWIRVLSSPGLSHIPEYIFDSIDAPTLAAVEHVSKVWRDHIVFNRQWRRKLLNHMAPEGSYTRRVLDTRSRLKEVMNDPEVDWIKKSNYCRRLCWKLTRRSLRERWGQRGEEDTIRFLPTGRLLVRSLCLDSDATKLIVARDTAIDVFDRNKLATAGSSRSSEAKLFTLKGHRRPVDCLDVDGSRVMSGGRDRALYLWNLDTGLNLAKQENAHARGITSVKLMGDRAVTSSKDKCVKLWGLTSDFTAIFLLRTIGHPVCLCSPNTPENPNSYQEQTQWVFSRSVWAVDFNMDYIAVGSSDRVVRFFLYNRDRHSSSVKEDEVGSCMAVGNERHDIRQVHLIRTRRHFAVTGDLRGGVRVWNLKERTLASTIDDQEGYRLDNAVVGISEEESMGYLALAFSNGRISVFIISDDDSGDILIPGRVVNLGATLSGMAVGGGGTTMIRSLAATPTEIVVGMYSGVHSVVAVDVWEDDTQQGKASGAEDDTMQRS